MGILYNISVYDYSKNIGVIDDEIKYCMYSR